MPVLRLIALLFCLPVVVYGHPVEPCRARLAQLAATLKDCEISQAEKGQCEQPKLSLEAQIAQCKQQQFTSEAVNSAIDYGYASLEGDVGQSPYRRQMRKLRWETSLMKPNIVSFNQLFPGFDHIQDGLTELFNRDACPKQYLGSSNRFLYFGSTQISQYPDSDEENAKPFDVRVHWFQPEQKGECYSPVVSAEEGAPTIVNLPAQFLTELERVQGNKNDARIVRCQSAACEVEKAGLDAMVDHYQKQYRLHRQLMICSDIDQRNENRKHIKGKRRSAYSLPDYCPEEEIQVKELNARGLLEQLEQSLFHAVTIRIQTAKSE